VELLYESLFDVLPMVVVIVFGSGALWLVNKVMVRRASAVPGSGIFNRQLTLAVLGTILFVIVVIAAPLPDATRHDLITLFGVALTGVIALSSTTLASNAMAGLMLRIVRNFKRGDVVRVAEYLGRVTEMGLFHTEIQNERSDLITLPNLFLAQNAVTVIRPSGTFISASLSLGYDLRHDEIEGLLTEAAKRSGLVEPFVRIRQLGDFSVTYEVSGRLADTKTFLGSKSALHRAVLDTLHEAGVEIVSPTFMNQRQLHASRLFIPDLARKTSSEGAEKPAPDSLVFDKADQVEKVEDLRQRLAALDEEIAGLETKAKEVEKGEAEKITQTIFLRQRIRERLVTRIAEIEAEVKD
jgi:small-conductance mechanosensitive channel